ncbi:MAG: hypothetical protein OXE81_09570, partial [Gammaproteobacteria bacterium]|nr:hypothetical protein [Gammaproteobacteria bacterium]
PWQYGKVLPAERALPQPFPCALNPHLFMGQDTRMWPVAQVLPYQHRCANLIGSMKGEITIHGDIMSTDIEWDAQS